MDMNLSYYLFLSHYIPLPLSALKMIENDKKHPLRQVEKLNRVELKESLGHLNNQPGISIRNIDAKVQKIQNLMKQDFIKVIERYLDNWREDGIKILNYFDKFFPKRLKIIKNSPKAIFYIGDFAKLNYTKGISIIGTRKPTQYGSSMAKKIGKRFAELGFTVINGFANGIDTLAIEGALSAGGKVIGVLGSGLLNPYPKKNLELFKEIIKDKKGAFISEQLPDNQLTKATLAVRNRISSALSLGNIIIEAGESSGTRWQVDFGKKQGKNLIVLKPNSNSEQAYLPKYLIENEKDCFIINNISDVDGIAKSILETIGIKHKDGKNGQIKSQKSITDY